MSILLQPSHFKKRLIPILFSALLSACTANFFGNASESMLQQDANASSDFYINKIYQAQKFDEQQTYKLLAARVMLEENKLRQAQALLAELKDLTPEQLLDKSIIEANILALQNRNTQAEQLLLSLDKTTLSASQSARYYDVFSRIAQNRYDVINAVKANIKAEQFLTDVQRKRANIDRTWALLRQANQGIINSTNTEGDATLAGWINLTQLYNQFLYTPNQLSQGISQWQTYYPNHPANHLMPTKLRGLLNFQQTQLSQVALLLPMSGNLSIIGKTVKAGFDAAKGDAIVNVQIFDTIETSLEDILTQVKQAGITHIVGPLQKRNVDTLINNATLAQGLNVLALNSTNNEKSIPQMCYYGLSPEDEAESAANRIWNEGLRNPLVFVPQNDWGQRTASAFNMRWQQLAATDANIRFYNQATEISFQNAEANTNEVQAVYLVISNPEQLAEIKTAIDNSGRNIKLYSNSRGHSSNIGAEFRSLAEGVLFSDIPFFNDMTSNDVKKIAKLTNNDYSLMRLYAMGADAWLLINHFNELRQIPGYEVSGLTGKLKAGTNCNIERDMTWFQYQNGNITPLN
ncbi:ABC transporter substrate-binding protein [[Haemophilus] felis]|nr:ABC transporter substrate-binding protein [[Haemophilus] felis]